MATSRRALIGVTAVLAVGLAHPIASPAAVTVGSSLRSIPSEAFCPAAPPCAVIQDHLVAPARVTAPFDGVVVRWSVKGSGPLRLFIARYTADDVAQRQITSERVSGRGIEIASSSSRLPIRHGDFLGIWLETTAS